MAFNYEFQQNIQIQEKLNLQNKRIIFKITQVLILCQTKQK